MKIRSLRIKNFQQFEDITLDFTDPATKSPLNKVCFIGSNGTGKSTILELLNKIVRGGHNFQGVPPINLLLDMDLNGERVYLFKSAQSGGAYWLNPAIDETGTWFETLSSNINRITKYTRFHYGESPVKYNELLTKSSLKDNSSDLIINSPAEGGFNQYLSISDVPEGDLQAALTLFQNFPYYHLVSNETVSDFWKILVYGMKKRENDREAFENDPRNLEKTKKQLIEEFEKNKS